MKAFKIVGVSKPNKLKLVSMAEKKLVELPKRQVKKMMENDIIQIINPERLYVRI